MYLQISYDNILSNKYKLIILSCIILSALISSQDSYAQAYNNSALSTFTMPFVFKNDTNKVTLYYRFRISGYPTKDHLDSVVFLKQEAFAIKEKPPILQTIQSEPFLKIHGNIAYSFDYRSRLDTPFAARNLQQHTEQTYLDAVIKNRYPIRIIINARQSNSPYFKNYTDVNLQFNHQDFLQKTKEAMVSEVRRKASKADEIAKYEQSITSKKEALATLKSWVENPARMQEIVQEKEQLYEKYLHVDRQQQEDYSAARKSVMTIMDSALLGLSTDPDRLTAFAVQHSLPLKQVSKDSLWARLHQATETETKLHARKKELDSLFQVLQVIHHQVDSLKQSTGAVISDVTGQIRNARSAGELEAIAKKEGVSSLGKADKALLSVTQLGIGRSAVNYSDLTVSNISITGINIEYNPSLYYAFAAGSVNYLFRDFVIKPDHMPRQNMVLGRFGWGDKNNRIFVFTAYTGTKNSFNGMITDTSLTVPVVHATHLFGYSLEAKYKLNQNADASFEVAKSSSAYNPGADWSKSLSHAFAFSERDNEAWSAKLNISIPELNSSANLFYRKVGANFQSYSIYNSGNRQEAWGIKWRQNLFKNQLAITLQVRKSSFDDPLIPLNYKSSMVLKSLQAVYRRKKWPVVSFGYMPTTQLIKSANGYYSQSIYYALTTNLFYAYKLCKLNMYSNLMYSRFYNQGTDSGFVLYNSKNILYSHTIDLGKWHSQSDLQYTKQPHFAYWTFEQSVDWQIAKHLSAGAGVKNNKIQGSPASYWGGTARIDWQVKPLGTLRLQYDKGYLSNGINGLEPNDWGRATWIKTF